MCLRLLCEYRRLNDLMRRMDKLFPRMRWGMFNYLFNRDKKDKYWLNDLTIGWIICKYKHDYIFPRVKQNAHVYL